MYFAETDTVSIVHVWEHLWNLGMMTPSITLHCKIYNGAAGLGCGRKEVMNKALCPFLLFVRILALLRCYIFYDERPLTSPTHEVKKAGFSASIYTCQISHFDSLPTDIAKEISNQSASGLFYFQNNFDHIS